MSSNAHASARRAPRFAGPLLALAALALALLALECGVRVVGQLTDARELARQSARAAAPRGVEAPLGDLIRPSASPQIIYELRPGLDTQFHGVPVRTSAAGFRSPELPVERAPGSVRIVGLGDSVMFGWGVPQEATFLSRLEARLNAEHPAKRWEVLNTAAPGYNAVMEVATLREKGLRYAPDVVVMDWVSNDIYLPNFLLLREDWWTPRRSFLLELVQRRLAAQPWLQGSRLIESTPWRNERSPERVPPAYRDQVGWDAYERALAELAQLSRDHDFAVVITSAVAHMPERALRRIGRQGFAIADIRPAMERALAEVGARGREGSPLALSKTDSHPSPRGHQLAADVLYDELVASGIVARLERRTP